jgi:hypothetical protein
MKYKYAFGLHSNARAFAESTVDYARQNNKDQWKFAILHLTTALELLLKARLAIENHCHLVGGNAPITERQFDEGDFKSVSIDECIKRLKCACGFTLSDRQNRVIAALRKLRNRVVHYIDPSSDTAALKAVVAAGLNMFIEINEAEFPDEDPYGARTMSQLVVELHKYDDFVEGRLSSLSGRLDSAVRPRTHHADECSDCLQDAAIIIDDELRCLFCGSGVAIHEYAELISGDWSVEACPECKRRSVARHQVRDGASPTYECFCCGYFRGPELQWRM